MPKPLQIVEADPERQSFTYSNISAPERRYHDRGRNYHAHDLPAKATFYRKFLDVDVACIAGHLYG